MSRQSAIRCRLCPWRWQAPAHCGEVLPVDAPPCPPLLGMAPRFNPARVLAAISSQHRAGDGCCAIIKVFRPAAVAQQSQRSGHRAGRRHPTHTSSWSWPPIHRQFGRRSRQRVPKTIIKGSPSPGYQGAIAHGQFHTCTTSARTNIARAWR